MKNTTRKWFNEKVKNLKEDLKSAGYKAAKGAVTVSLAWLLAACGSSDVSKKVKAYDNAKQELVNAQENLKKQQEDVKEAQDRLQKATQDEAETKANLKEATKNL